MLEWEHAKDPASDGTFTMEWGDFLDGATVAASSWTLPAGITSASDTFNDFDTFVKLAGGTDNTDYVLDNEITDSNGDKWERSVTLKVRER